MPRVHPPDRKRILTDLLRGVSRAFYLTLRVLPAHLREPIGLAYLLARAADTIADTRWIPPDERLRQLLVLRAQIEGPASARALRQIEDALTDKQGLPAEKLLVQSLPEIFCMLEGLQQEDRARVRKVVVTLTRGMEMDFKRFPAEDKGEIGALQHEADLDTYIYYVAGCVGEFWTEMSVAHEKRLADWDVEQASAVGVRFGKALQLTNVLRDVPRDLRIGRCYLPEDELNGHGVKPRALLDLQTAGQARPVLVRWLGVALDHFRAAEAYTLAIPRRCLRHRLAVLWPILIGLGTLEKVSANPKWLDPDSPSKVKRGWVYRMMLLSVPCALSDTLIHWWIAWLRRRVERNL